MKRLALIASAFAFVAVAHAQNPNVLITDPDFTGPNECDCQNVFVNGSLAHFFDSGGSGANYSDNEDETIVFCPDLNTGTKVSIAFGVNAGFSWGVHGSDSVYVYDGNSTAAPLLGVHNSDTDPNGFQHAASWANNPSGCLTVRFVSNGADNDIGWAANVTCGNVPQPFDPNISGFINGAGFPNTSAINPADTGYVDVCFGDSVLFMGSGTFPNSFETTGYGYSQNSGNCTYEWEFLGQTFTGDSIWFVPPARAGYQITMTITDPIGWIQQIKCKVRVSTIPSFAGTIAEPDTICLGSTSTLIGGVTNTDTVGVDPTLGSFEVGGVFAGLTYLPDGSGANYQTSIAINDFNAGDTIAAGSDVTAMCVTMEHSYLGDLEMVLECPNGQTATIFNSYSGGGDLVPGGFNGGGTYLGDAYDNNIGNPGIGWEYCFDSNAPTFGTMAAEFAANNTVPTTLTPGNAMNPNGIYDPEDPWSNFIGCPINGNWTITVRDNLSIDDGYIFEWGIFFDPAINPNTEFYTPQITSETWLPDPTISLDGDTTLTVTPDNTGDFPYTFQVTDNFGCTYDTTIIVHVLSLPVISSDAFACDQFYQFTGNTAPNGGIWSYSSPFGTATFSPDNTVSNPSVTVTENGIYDFTFTDQACGLDTTVQILFISDPVALIEDATLCDGESIVLEGLNEGIGASYNWSPSGSTDADIEVTTSGVVTLTVTNSCGSSTDDAVMIFEACAVVVPNVFSPGSDGYNDNFVIAGLEKHENSILEIYNRWGKIIYTDSDYKNDWNGDIGGKKASSGTYYYILTLENEDVYTGTVNIMK